MAGEDSAPPGSFSPPAPTGGPPAPGGGDNQFINQFMQWMQQVAGGGGGGGGFGGINPMAPVDPLGLGMGGMGGMGDPLSLGTNPVGGNIGLNPYQAAGLRLRRSNEMNMLRQNMANAHRGIGRAGGRDYSRHVQNIDDEILALQEQKVQDNIKNALAYNQQLAQYGQQNVANFQKLAEALGGGEGRLLRYGQDDKSPGTFSPSTQEQPAEVAG